MLSRSLFLSALMVLWPYCDAPPRKPAFTVDNVCASLPDILCDGRRDICDETGLGGENETCLARERALCEENARDTLLGSISFFGQYVDECKVAMRASPIVSRHELGEAIVVHSSCGSIFQGKRQVGEDCERDAQCIQPDVTDSFARCNRWQKCEIVRELTQGEVCEVDSDGNHHCADGLGCVVPNMSARNGICIESLALGQSCSPHTAYYLCGRDAFCDIESGTCVSRLTLGERCYFGWQCLSGHCMGDYCAPDSTLFSGFECGVPCLGDLCQ